VPLATYGPFCPSSYSLLGNLSRVRQATSYFAWRTWRKWQKWRKWLSTMLPEQVQARMGVLRMKHLSERKAARP
jgi:hypothetical protein